MTEMTSVPLTSIELDTSIQCRATIDMGIVNEYADRMQAGDTFPPVDLYGTTEQCWIGDGWHRVLAVKRDGHPSYRVVQAHLHPGGRIDALRHALGANAIHGQRRSNGDKRRAVEIAVVEFATLSNAAIATLCGVDDKTVAAYRPVTSGNSEPETRTGQDGKQYPGRRKQLSRQKKRELLARLKRSRGGVHQPESVPQPPADDHHDQDDQPAPASLEPVEVPVGDTEAAPTQTLDQRIAMLFAGQAIFVLAQIEDDDVDLDEALASVEHYITGRRAGR